MKEVISVLDAVESYAIILCFDSIFLFESDFAINRLFSQEIQARLLGHDC